jgi:hypothetical protein
VAFATAVVLLPATVFADGFRLRVEDISGGGNGYGVVLTDGNTYAAPVGTVGDENSEAGLLSVTLQPLSGAVTWNLTVGISKPFFFDPSDPLGGLRLTSFNVTSTGAATIRITLEDTGFANPGSGPVLLQSALGGTFCGPVPMGNPTPCTTNGAVSVAATSWANASGATPTLGADTTASMLKTDGTGTYQLAAGTLSAIGANVGEHTDTLTATSSGTAMQDFSADTYTALTDSGPSFSLFTQLIVTFNAAGTVDFYHDTMLAANEQLTPEPASLMLIGTALAGLAMRRRALMN